MSVLKRARDVGAFIKEQAIDNSNRKNVEGKRRRNSKDKKKSEGVSETKIWKGLYKVSQYLQKRKVLLP